MSVSPLIMLAVSTLAALIISVYCLYLGWFIVFQNLFYIPIIIACIYYEKKGFAFSVVLSFVYCSLILVSTKDTAIIMQALIRVCLFISIAWVITYLTMKRKQEEGSSKASELKFRTIFDMANDGILIADPETKKFIDGNKSICRLLGYSLDEIKKMGVMDIHPKEALPYIIGQFEKQSRGEITVSKDLPIKLKDGSVRYADVNANAVDIGGKTYTMGLFRDVTERKQAEGMIAEKVKELERMAKIMEDREDKILELKKKIVELEKATDRGQTTDQRP